MRTPKLQGRLPEDARSMENDIPGIGRYSAGAICSIAYGERVPVVSPRNILCVLPTALISVLQLDGNVHRLLSRVLALHASPKAKATLDLLW
jgi:A/G-specific adenine glycosylase